MAGRTLGQSDASIINVHSNVNAVPTENPMFPIDIVLSSSGRLAFSKVPGQHPTPKSGLPASWLQHLLHIWRAVLAWTLAVTDPLADTFTQHCQRAHAAGTSPPALAFHPHIAKLAAVHGQRVVQVYDLEHVQVPQRADLAELAANLAESQSAQHRRAGPSLVTQAAAELGHESQGAVHDIAWRPQPAAALAAAHGSGVMLWRTVDSRQSPALHSQMMSRGFSNSWLMTALHWPCAAAPTVLAWHPNGRLLAAGGVDCGSIYVWDADQAQQLPNRCSLGLHTGAHVLKWSPCGGYLFVGRTNGSFEVFETLTWRSQAWTHRECGHLVDAAWSAKASPAAMLLCCSKQIVSLHFTEQAPSLHAQMLPLDARQVFDCEGGLTASTATSDGLGFGRKRALSAAADSSVVGGFAWDSRRDLLLVGLAGKHRLAGNALLYATSQHPLMAAVCMGPVYLRGGQDEELRAEKGRNRIVMGQGGQGRAALLAARSSAGCINIIPLGVRDAGRELESGSQASTFFRPQTQLSTQRSAMLAE